MNILSKIFRKPIQPNDTRGFAAYEIDGLIRQPQSMAERDLLVLTGLAANTVYEIDMINHLGHDVLVTGLTADIVDDDAKVLQPGNQRPNYSTIQLIIQLLDRSNKTVKREIVVFISGYGSNISNELVLAADGLYRFKLNQTVKDISILGVPVIVGSPRIAHNLPVVQPENNNSKM